MPALRPPTAAALALALLALGACRSAPTEDWRPLLVPGSLAGWHTAPGGRWEWRDDVLVGTSEASETRHGLLISDERFDDFEAQLRFRTVRGNSGFYFRADEIGGAVGVAGFQAEVEPDYGTGGLYETAGRAWVVQADPELVKSVYTPGDWTDMTVRAVGGDVEVRVNGTLTAALTDDPGRRAGHFALQLHGGQDMQVEFEGLQVRRLDPTPLALHTRARRPTRDGGEELVEETLRWDPRRTAVVVVDMWDDHWCRGAARRVVELAGPVDALLAEARRRGVLVVHAPSSVVGFYEGTPARRRAQEAAFAPTPVPLSEARRWGTAWCWPDPAREPELPIDDSDMGCDCSPECELGDPWTRQVASLTIDGARDAVTDDGQELWNLLQERDVEHVLVLGVHLNMCVLGRPVAIRQLVALGLDVALVRDLTDSMYDRDMAPFVDHFAGTRLVVEHVERHWCPTILSSDLTGRPPFRFAGDPGG